MNDFGGIYKGTNESLESGIGRAMNEGQVSWHERSNNEGNEVELRQLFLCVLRYLILYLGNVYLVYLTYLRW